jgi:regulator of protease activity HflC (stomatin/prohibitin superfamily)
MQQFIDKFRELLSGGKIPGLILPVIALVVVIAGLLSGGLGFVEIQPGEAAVIYNTVFSKSAKVRLQQGTQTYIPILQRVEILNIEPQVLIMEGEAYEGPDRNRVQRLTVRARDGSKLWFNRLEIHYEAIPSSADILLRAHGLDDAYEGRPLIVQSREVLRNEFGRFSFLEIADPSNYAIATTRARETLNQRMQPFGIRVTQIITPKPSFDNRIEHAIEERQTAGQQVEVEQEKRNRMIAQKERFVQDVTEGKNKEFKDLVAILEASVQGARNRQISTRREADIYYTSMVAQCEAGRDADLTRAEANRDAFRQQAEGLAARIKAVGQMGDGALDLTIAEHIFPQLENVAAAPFATLPATIDVLYSVGGN